MTKVEARKLFKDRAATRLVRTEVAILGALLDSAFVPPSRQESTDIETVGVKKTLRQLALKAGVGERSVLRHLPDLISQGLVKVSGPDGARRTYFIDLTQMADWELVKTVRTREEKTRRETKNSDMREYRAKKARPSWDGVYWDSTDEETCLLLGQKAVTAVISTTLSPADFRKLWEETPSTEKALKQQRLHEWATSIENAKAKLHTVQPGLEAVNVNSVTT